MKMKHLLKKAFLLLALVGGTTSAWATTETVSWTDMATSSHNANKAGVATSVNLTPANGVVTSLNTNGSVTKDFGQGSTTYYRYAGFDVDEDNAMYFEYSFSVASGYAFTPSKISVGWAPNGGKAISFAVYAGTSSSNLVKVGTLVHGSDNTYSVDDITDFSALGANTDFTLIRLVPYGKKSSIVLNSVEVQGSLVSSSAPGISAADASITATTSGVEATQSIDVTGINLTGSTLTATLSPAVDGLSVTLGSDVITAGAISTTATLHYTKTTNVKQNTTTLTLSDGTTTKDVTITYSAKVTDWTLQSISEATTWNWNKFTANTESPLYANSGISLTSETTPSNTTEFVLEDYDGVHYTIADGFDGTTMAFKGAFPTRNNTFCQLGFGGTLKFNTTVAGAIKVDFSDTGSSGESAKRYLNVNGTNTVYYTQRDGSTSDRKTTGYIFVPSGDIVICAKAEDGTSNQNINIYSVTFTPTVSKDISAAGWATYCSPYALDLEHATGLTDAYIITGASGNVLNTTSVVGGTIPANTGILIQAPEGTVTIPVVASSETNVSTNKLVGVTASTEKAAESIYVLMNEATGVGFYKNNNAFTVGANTAYLNANFANAARSAYFFDGVTGVDAVKAAAVAAKKDGKFFKDGKLFIFKNGKKFNANGQLIK